MLYIGSFHNYRETEVLSAHFIYFAEADDPNGAVEIFKAGIKKMAEQSDTGITGMIFLESLIGIRKMPAEGVMAFFQEIDYQEPGSTITCTLPGDASGIESYYWSEDDKEPGDIFEMAPFLTIPNTKKRRC